jgi:pimeloyl-ACP methyl ester carboxylesterase
MHGYVGSRLDAAEWHDTAVKHGVRLICIDRPGYGLSTFQPGRQLLNLPVDIRRLARHLGFKSYYVYGQSGGGPYTVACAHALPREELKGAAVVAGMGPWECGTKDMKLASKIIFWSIAYTPKLLRLVMKYAYTKSLDDYDQEELEQEYRKGLKWFKEKDREVLSKPASIKAVIATMREGFRQGKEGALYDGIIFTSPWEFELGQLKDRKILFFHGTEDENVPISHAQYLVERLAGAELIKFEGDTHFTICPKRYPEIMARLLQEGER